MVQTTTFLHLYKAAERVSFFGCAVLLQLWLQSALEYSVPDALAWRSYFTAAVYFFSIVGGYVADVHLGPYATLALFTVPSTLGLFGLGAVSYLDWTTAGLRAWALVSLILIALGSGATKPCGTVVGADQLPAIPGASKAERDAQVQGFTTTFYLVCQIAGLSIVLTPLLKHHTSYGSTFMVLGGVSTLSLLAIVLGDLLGTRQTLEGTGHVRGFSRPQGQPFVLGAALGVMYDNHCCCGRRRHQSRGVSGVGKPAKRHSGASRTRPTSSTLTTSRSSSASTTTSSFAEPLLSVLEKEAMTSDRDTHEKLQWEVAQTLNVFLLFSPLVIYSGLTFQTFSSWQTQATELDLNTHIFGKVLVEQLIIVKFLMVIPLLPLCKKLPLQPLARMGLGFAATGLAFIAAGVLQTHAHANPGDVSVYYQLPQWLLLSIGETLVSPSLLQFAYTEAPASMKTVVQAGANVTDVLGNVLAGVCFKWLPASLATQFYVFGGVMLALATAVHLPLARWYHPLPEPKTSSDPYDHQRPPTSHHGHGDRDDDHHQDQDQHTCCHSGGECHGDCLCGHDDVGTIKGHSNGGLSNGHPRSRLSVVPPKADSSLSLDSAGQVYAASPAVFDRIRELSSGEHIPDLRLGGHPDSAEEKAGDSRTARVSAGETAGKYMECRCRRNRIPSLVPPTSAVIIVDPFSSGALMASQVPTDTTGVVRVLSRQFPQAQLDFVPPGLTLEYLDTVTHDNEAPDQESAVQATIAALRSLPYKFVAVIAGSEPGVELTDSVAEGLGLPGNATELSACRRDKFLMINQLHENHVRAARQMLLTGTTPDETVREFLRELQAADPTGNGWVVAKPTRSCGGDDVTLCFSPEDVFRYKQRVLMSKNNYGMLNSAVVLQEFLHSVNGSHDEYVVDSVSKNGRHKICAVWEYDKRPTNGAPFVYFGMRLVAPDAPEFMALCDYVQDSLDALGIEWGPSHAEVMLTAAGPVLVEVGARLHGVRGSFVPLVDAAVGYNQVSVSLAAYGAGNDGVDFESLPDRYSSLNAHAAQVFLISRKTGKLRSLPRLAEIRGLPSWHADDIKAPGTNMVPTQDGWSSPGYVSLLHEDPAVVMRNYSTILHATGFRGNPKWAKTAHPTRAERRSRVSADTMPGQRELFSDGMGELFDIVGPGEDVEVVVEGK